MTDHENPLEDAWGEVTDDYVCEFCDRSIITRFGGVPSNECDSCQDNMKRLHAADKLRTDGWSLVVVKIGEEDA